MDTERIELYHLSEAHGEFYRNSKLFVDNRLDGLKRLDLTMKEKRLEKIIANGYIHHYQGVNDFLERIQLMQSYLLLDYWYGTNNNYVSIPPDYPDLYNPNRNYTGWLSTDPLPNYSDYEPDLSVDQLKTNFAINHFRNQHSIRFISRHADFKRSLMSYWRANNFSKRSLEYAEDLLRNYESGGIPLYDDRVDGVYSSANVAFQTEDRPEIIFTSRISSKGLNYGIKGLGDFLAGISEIPTRPEWEGQYIYMFLNENGIKGLLNNFTYEEIGRLFDFSLVDPFYIRIRFDSSIDYRLFEFDRAYGKSIFQNQLKIKLMKLLADGEYGEVQEIVDFFVSEGKSPEAFTEAVMIAQQKIAQREWDYSDSGIYLGRQSLKYIATFNVSSVEKMYLLENGLVLYAASGPKVINAKYEGSLASTEVITNGYHYIYDFNTQRYYEYRLPQESYVDADIDFLFSSFWEGIKIFGRYATPLEDAIVLIDGKDFDGNFANRYFSGGVLLTSIIPGGTLLKPVTKIVEGTTFWVRTVKWGEKTKSLPFRLVNGEVEFGNRNVLGELLGTTADVEAHHIIPWKERTHPVIQRAAYYGFHPNMIDNGLGLQKYTKLIGDGLHGNHPAYTEYVRRAMEDWVSLNPNYSPQEAYEFLLNNLIPRLKVLINSAKNSGLNLNEYFKNLL